VVVLACLGALLGRPSSSVTIDDCVDFKSQAAAQSYFLKKGGPARDPLGFDPDGDGFACEGRPAPFKGLVTIDRAEAGFTGQLSSLDDACLASRPVAVFQVKKDKDKRIGVATTLEDGSYTVASTAAKGQFYAKVSATIGCAAETSPKLRLPVGRIEIAPAGVFFTGTGQTKPLEANVYDAAGAEVLEGDVFWRSSDPSIVSVSRSGIASSVADGTVQVTATIGGVTSAPILAIVTALPDGTLVLTDPQIIAGPTATAGDDPTFTIVATGIPELPAVDTLVMNIETKPVVGHVVSAEDLGDGSVRLTLAQAGLEDALPNLAINEVLDVSDAPVAVDPLVASHYDVKRTNNTFTFAPKTTTVPSARSAAAEEPKPPPFNDCKIEVAPSPDRAPIKVTNPPKFSIEVSPTLQISRSDSGFTFLIGAKPKITIEAGLTVAVVLEGKIECKRTLFTFAAPITGPLSALISGLIPVGIGFEVSGKFTVVDVGVSTKQVVKGEMTAGVQCSQTQACSFVRSGSFEAGDAEVIVNPPSVGDTRFEPEISAFAFVDPAIGNPALTKLSVTVLESKFGVKLGGSFALPQSQIVAEDYASNYALALFAQVKLGGEPVGILKRLGMKEWGEITLLDQSTNLAQSPTGALTVSKASLAAGDSAKFTARLVNVEFLGLYNVSRVLLLRKEASGPPTQIASLTAANGQRDFIFNHTTTEARQASDFYAFVVTKALPFDPLALEIGKATYAGNGRVEVLSRQSDIGGSFNAEAYEDDGQQVLDEVFDNKEFTAQTGSFSASYSGDVAAFAANASASASGSGSGSHNVSDGAVFSASSSGTWSGEAEASSEYGYAAAGHHHANMMTVRFRVIGESMRMSCTATAEWAVYGSMWVRLEPDGSTGASGLIGWHNGSGLLEDVITPGDYELTFLALFDGGAQVGTVPSSSASGSHSYGCTTAPV
jgi:hypothetical protein